MSDRVLVERSGGIATVTVNRPEKRNAMDVPTRKDLRDSFETVGEDDSVRAVILRGAGDGSFIAGGDIDSFAEFDHMEGLEYATKYAQGLYNYLAELPKPTVAAVDGYALGGGTEIALACDIRLATEDAKFGLPEVDIGVLPAGGGTQRLVQVVGAGRAKELILTGRIIDAGEAKEIGLANHVYPAADFDDAVLEMAESLTSKAPVAQRLAKESINRGLNAEQGLDFERMAGAFLFGTEDREEGMNAFLEDRDPEYEGR
ncbi:enoyl-CoA hydratase/isomerase family protein [Haladaptatus halobius]|uniref:enoyl-CoA hydratase/isomerase family protein n=1 Tax=Haladaptatus halobius TaxID=2884875 RepID=UPI001D0B54FB|nr:enoyl-CoA hydratase/isomerase family protein [Haladaptatus halobius]